MGYYTRFSLSVLDEDKQEIDSAIVPAWDEDLEYGISVQDLITGNTDSMKWYDHEKDMKSVSETYPNYIFILDGDGEESGDVWRKFYKNGSTYEWKLEFKRPEYSKKIEKLMI